MNWLCKIPAKRLMRRAGPEGDQSQLECQYGYMPRLGKDTHRRERDCTVDCSNKAKCQTQQDNAYWLTDPKREEK